MSIISAIRSERRWKVRLAVLWRVATNPYVVIGLTIYVCGTVFRLAPLSRVDLSVA
jgi:hypothetical protein